MASSRTGLACLRIQVIHSSVSSDGQIADSAIISAGFVPTLTAVQQRTKFKKKRLKTMLQRGEVGLTYVLQEFMLLRSVRAIVW